MTCIHVFIPFPNSKYIRKEIPQNINYCWIYVRFYTENAILFSRLNNKEVILQVFLLRASSQWNTYLNRNNIKSLDILFFYQYANACIFNYAKHNLHK